MRWAERLARMGKGDVYTGFWWGNLMEKNHFEDLGVHGRIILKLILTFSHRASYI
jgi:hypothetical protein